MCFPRWVHLGFGHSIPCSETPPVRKYWASTNPCFGSEVLTKGRKRLQTGNRYSSTAGQGLYMRLCLPQVLGLEHVIYSSRVAKRQHVIPCATKSFNLTDSRPQNDKGVGHIEVRQTKGMAYTLSSSCCCCLLREQVDEVCGPFAQQRFFGMLPGVRHASVQVRA